MENDGPEAWKVLGLEDLIQLLDHVLPEVQVAEIFKRGELLLEICNAVFPQVQDLQIGASLDGS